jgi:hypothetical protein
MPTINIFYDNGGFESKLYDVTAQLKKFVAKELTCGDTKLGSDEVSIRLLKSRGNGMLAPVELEVTAASFKERVEKQDEICLNIQKFLLDELNLSDIKVWLILSELGHSWK